MEISIVTPVFNRARNVSESINSSLRFLDESQLVGEIIIVDDASSDGTAEAILEEYPDLIKQNLIRLIILPVNLGPTGAKQIGATNSCGKWLIFMDSDDLFNEGVGSVFRLSLEGIPLSCPLIFFRCVDKNTGKIIGRVVDQVLNLDLKSYIARGTPGECLPVVRKECINIVPYHGDLRGFEQITYAQIIQRFGAAFVFPIIARIYNTNEDGNRLSTRYALRRRGCLLAKGYLRMLAIFGFRMGRRIPSTLVRIVYHSINCIFYRQ